LADALSAISKIDDAQWACHDATMIRHFFTPRANSATPEEVTHALKVNVYAVILGHVFFNAACYLTYRVFANLVPETTLWSWVIGTSLLLMVWLILEMVILFRRPSTYELIRIWAPVAKATLLGSDLVVITSMWLFLPAADQATMLMMMVMYALHVPTQMLCSPENTEINRIGIVSVQGSAVALLLTRGGEHEFIVAMFFIVGGLALFGLSNVARRSMQSVVTERLYSENVANELEQALGAVAKERDAKTKFIATASHDLAQPLQAASLFFDQTLRAPDEAARARASAGVQKALTAAEQLLSHMLSHLRLEADAVEPHPSRVELRHCFQRLRAQCLPATLEAGIELRFARTRYSLFLDPALLDRALGNLVSNALIHSGAKKILVACRRVRSDHLRIYVIDNGVGIGSVDAKHLFQDFYRGADSRALVKTGFGLGLSSVRRIATLMGGTAGQDQRWARGAAFYIEFPWSAQQLFDQPRKVSVAGMKG
jgi:signal transduction histidine kinase